MLLQRKLGNHSFLSFALKTSQEHYSCTILGIELGLASLNLVSHLPSQDLTVSLVVLCLVSGTTTYVTQKTSCFVWLRHFGAPRIRTGFSLPWLIDGYGGGSLIVTQVFSVPWLLELIPRNFWNVFVSFPVTNPSRVVADYFCFCFPFPSIPFCSLRSSKVLFLSLWNGTEEDVPDKSIMHSFIESFALFCTLKINICQPFIMLFLFSLHRAWWPRSKLGSMPWKKRLRKTLGFWPKRLTWNHGKNIKQTERKFMSEIIYLSTLPSTKVPRESGKSWNWMRLNLHPTQNSLDGISPWDHKGHVWCSFHSVI